MGPTQLQRLKEIFHSARDLPLSERAAYLDQACEDDAELRREIEALLKAGQEAQSFATQAPADLAAEAFGATEIPTAVGRIIGRYKLLERIGSGGMGDVYLAERADQQFKMQVAVKLIKRGMDTESVLRRFQHERQILASLEHPNIARLLDGGTTDDGLPYFVMEYIKGERIDRYTQERALSVEARLELFRPVCGAVSYAHQHLVVHRDLKPSNILVTSEGVPKLLDFGIAKIIQAGEGADEALPTITVGPIMTPEYASPEQIQGASATTLSDVYSLGAVLYELLSGRPPHRLKTRSREEIAHAVTRAEIERPSAVATRPEDARRLRGDLDNIVLMAMRRESARRYRTVEQLSEDIRRHLSGRPVTARPDTISYRAAKFVQRNKIGVAAAVLIFALLLGGIIATAWQAKRARLAEQRARAEQARAERRFAEVRKLANKVLFDYHEAIKFLPGATKARELLVKDALEYLDGLAGEAQEDPALQRELAAAYERVSDVRRFLGDSSGALESATKALGIREALLALNSNDTQARHDLAESHQQIGQLGRSGTSGGVEHLRKALALYRDLTLAQPWNDTFRIELADTYNKLGGAMSGRGERAGALEQHRAAVSICEKALATNPRDQSYRRALFNANYLLADVLLPQGDDTGAFEAISKALAIGEGLIADDPINAEHRRALTLAYKKAGDIRNQSDPPAALEYFRRAIVLEEEGVASNPADVRYRKDLAYSHKRIAEFLANLHDNAQALLHFRKALEISQKLAADTPADLSARFSVASLRAGVAGMRARLGEVDGALQECGQATEILQAIAEDPMIVGFRTNRAEAYEYLGYAYGALADATKNSDAQSKKYWRAARDMFQESLNVLADMRSRGILSASAEKWGKSVAEEVAKCDAALGKK